MKTTKLALCLDPQPPDGFEILTDVTEVFPDSPYAIVALIARLSDGQFAVWADIRASMQTCSPARTFGTEDEAKAAHATLVADLLEYAYPEASG